MGFGETDCSASWCVLATSSVGAPVDWLGSAESGRKPTTVCLVARGAQSAPNSASTIKASACSRVISVCNRSRLSESSEQCPAAFAPPSSDVACAVTKTAKESTVDTADTATGKVIDACVGHDIGYEDSKHEYVIRGCRRIHDSGSADEVLVLPRALFRFTSFKDLIREILKNEFVKCNGSVQKNNL